MIRVKYFDNAAGLEYLINKYKIEREDIIDIKWAATEHCACGLLIYEVNTEPSKHEETSITSSGFTYSGFGL